MCGIAGYIGRGSIDAGRIAQTLDLMGNRGPDNRAHIVITSGDVNVVLLHSRLSIIDLDPRANQPFSLGDCTMVYNGEIYNYVELRARLEQEKHVRFKTQSDTEVLLQSYLTWGEKCVGRFEGMWSFAIYDGKERKLFLSRDRFAEKPLYFMRARDGYYFGSEVKFIRALSGANLSVNTRHLMRYLVNGYKSLYKTADTFFNGIEEVPYAMNLAIDGELKLRSARYWTPICKPTQMTVAEAVAGFRERLLESMRIRLRADVPLAFCLSGGVDSAALTSIAAKKFGYHVATFSIMDQDERYNEYDNIKATVDDLHCRHTIIDIPKKGFLDRMKQLIAYHDSPVATISYYVHSFLSEAISKGGYKVAVSGTAADELVTGYYDHFNLHLYEMRNRPEHAQLLADWRKYVSGMVRNPHLQNPQLYDAAPGFRKHIYLNNDIFAACLKEDFNEEFFEEKYCESLLRNRMMNELFHEAVPVILHEDDLNSMCYSVENRSPYLDSRLFDFSYSIPAEHLIHDGYAKNVLREAVKGILNEQVRKDRRKKGFNASIHSVVDLHRGPDNEYLLDGGPIYDIVRKEKISEIMKINPMPNSYSKFMFNFINAKIFLELNT